MFSGRNVLTKCDIGEGIKERRTTAPEKKEKDRLAQVNIAISLLGRNTHLQD